MFQLVLGHACWLLAPSLWWNSELSLQLLPDVKTGAGKPQLAKLRQETKRTQTLAVTKPNALNPKP